MTESEGVKALVVVLAGGQGTRFWPISRGDRPKQFLSVCPSGESLIAATARRMLPLVGESGVIVVGAEQHRSLLQEHVPYARLVCEPVSRNTAPAIGLAALLLQCMDPDALMVLLPADHAVADEDKLRESINFALETAAQHDVLVTVGIEPSFPHTGYGYIQRGEALDDRAFKVSRFYEKPNLERAQRYFDSDRFYWNSGMFVWRPEVLLRAIEAYMPELHAGLGRIRPALGTEHEAALIAEVFEELESISIDFGVLEHAQNCAVIPAEPFGWNDVGSWDAWAEHFQKDADGNLLHGDALVLDSRDSIVHSEERLTALLGVEDLVVIDSPAALLVCPRERVQDVRKIVAELKVRGRNELV